MRNLFFLVFGLTFLWPSLGLCVGLCEDTKTTLSVHSFSEKTMELILYGEKEWCHEKEDGAVVVEDRGRWKVARLIQLKGGSERWFVDGADTQKIKQRFLSYTGQKTVDSFISLAEYKKKNGFVDYLKSDTSPNGTCRISLKKTAIEDEASDFPHARFTMHIHHGVGKVHQEELGRIADGREARSALLFLPKKQLIVGWFELPICEAGPTPGYFGEDDPGTCYEEYDTQKIMLGQKDLSWVSTCFPKPPTQK